MGDDHPLRVQGDNPRGAEEQELAFLNHVLQALTSTLDLDEVLALVLEELRQLLEVTASSIWLKVQNETVTISATSRAAPASRASIL